MKQINSKITNVAIVKEKEKKIDLDREEVLEGKTYKIKSHIYPDAFYVTINNKDGKPYEIFINSKGLQQFRFMALTRLISALFRREENLDFIIEELKAIHDPMGSYTSKRKYPSGKSKRFDSIEAEIGDIIEEHIYGLKNPIYIEPPIEGFPSNATICPECKVKAVIIMDGCSQCLDCGASKCS